MAFHEYIEHPGIIDKKAALQTSGVMQPVDSGESDEDSLALLPRHTVVKVIGNNRTKQCYIGMKAVVKRAVGLGGWHWLVLASGEEIKLQRNALLVLEHPTGNEQEFSEEEREEEQRQLAEVQQRQRQMARQQQLNALEYDESRARQRRAPRPLITEEYMGGANERVPRMAMRSLHPPRINLGKLDIAALKRCRNYYRLPEAATTKDDLVSLVEQQFAEQVLSQMETVDEAQVISHFLRAAKRHTSGGGLLGR